VSRRLLVVGSFLLVFGATAAVRTGERAPQPTTVAKVRGSIEALAQDGRRIAWMETNASCGKQVQILTLPRRHPVYVGSSQGKSCRLRGRTFGAIALTADGRVLWQGLAGFGNTEFDYDVFTAALRAPRTRLVAAFALSYDAGDPDDYFRWGRPLPMAAHGTTAVFFGHQDIGGYKGIKPGIFRLVGGRSRHLADVTGPGGLAVSGGRFADVTNSPRCCNDTPVWSHDGTRLAWIYHGNLWTIHADGTRDRQLAAGAATPSWSPDDTQLVFEHRETSGARGIYRVNANGGGLLRLAAGSTPAWSPDGTRIAFVRGKDVYSIAAGGTAARKLTKTERPTSGPLSWSPDSTRIAVSRAGDIYTVRADGAGEVRLTTSQRPETQPAWSPNGAEIAYALGSTLAVVNADGTGPVRSISTGSGPSPASSPAWSRDSSRIAFMRPAGGSLWIVNADGSGQRRLGVGKWDSPQWSLDGRTIVVGGDFNGEAGGDLPSDSAIRLVSAIDGKATVIAPNALSPVAIRNARTGHLIKRFAIHGHARAIALGLNYIALLVDHNPGLRVELYNLSGSFRSAVAVPSRVDTLSAAGRSVVFAAGHAIRRLDARTGVVSTLATGRRTPVGLTIEGRRVVWAENTRGVARIQAVRAP
jgi:Tol biopolymer transport system component